MDILFLSGQREKTIYPQGAAPGKDTPARQRSSARHEIDSEQYADSHTGLRIVLGPILKKGMADAEVTFALKESLNLIRDKSLNPARCFASTSVLRTVAPGFAVAGKNKKRFCDRSVK